MKKSGVLAVLLALAVLAACGSTPTPDPDNGVSNASYRSAVSQADTSALHLVSKFQQLEQDDLARPKAQQLHSQDWWDALTHEAQAQERLLSGVLQGSTSPVSSGAK